MYAVVHDGVAPLVSQRPTGTPAESTAASFPQVKVDGPAIFDWDRLVALLDERGLQGVMWARGEVRSAIIAVTGAGVQDELGAFVVRRARSRMQV